MIVQLSETEHTIKVIKQETDKKKYKKGYALPESGFLYDVMKELKKQGYDVLKKRMWKDGHLVDDDQQYIRERKGNFYIYNTQYALYDAGEEFNQTKVGDCIWLGLVC
jgi:hypothetical protein